mmetsp:Transcript_19556/g.17307  ORF Transcript_19556/g.17307 Transcript_19556/m.17307 type:complete len:202 (+) Transcript_19556:245-850(+)
MRSRYSISEVHEKLPSELDKSKLQYKFVDQSYLEEIKKLHQEWFPVHYGDDYYEKINQKETICMGAFSKDILIGLFIGHFKSNYITKQLSNKSRFSFGGTTGLYIATIGVVDGARRLGIGTLLIDEVLKWVKIHHSDTETIFLHVIDYNNAAIKFYENNDFSLFGKYSDYYFLGGKFYDSYLYYKRLSFPRVQERKRKSRV